MSEAEENKATINMKHGMLSGIFGGAPVSATEMFSHPLEEELLVKTMTILQKSETGAHLLGVVKEKALGIRVIKNRNVHGYTTDNKIIFFGLPPRMTEPDGFAVLELGAAIREIEQELVGFTMPEDDSDPMLSATTRHAKYLDIVVFMCKIAYEIRESIGDDKCVEAIYDLGHGDTYETLINGIGMEAVAKAYVESNNRVVESSN